MRLFLTEDETSLSRALVKILEHANYSVDAVYDGQEALDYLETSDYDGVILDIMMPVKDGLEVLQTIRQAGNQVPAIQPAWIQVVPHPQTSGQIMRWRKHLN